MSELVETDIGTIPDKWILSTVKEEAEFVTDYVANGSFASLAKNVTYKREPDYAVLIRLADFNANFKGDFVYVDEHAYRFLKKSKLFGGEVIISNVGEYSGTVFRTPKLNKPMTLAPNAIMMDFKNNNDFYYYWFISRIGQHFLKSILSGSAQPKFNKTDFRNLIIPVPSIEEQKAIASILSSLDSKIDLLRRQNQTLENIAQALFKRWFVDFEFPDKNGKPYKSSGGKMIESEFGEIPEGWSKVNLIDIANVVDCSHSKKPSQVKEGRFLLQVYNIGKYGNLNLNEKYYVSDNDYIEWTKRIEVREGDMIISKTGRVGAIAQIPVNIKAGLGRNLVAIRAKKIIDHVYLKDLMLSNFMRREIEKGTNAGTILSSLHVKEINQLSCYLPRKHNLDGYKNVTLPIQKKINENLWHIQTLNELRDTLLPRLMSGQIRVKGL